MGCGSSKNLGVGDSGGLRDRDMMEAVTAESGAGREGVEHKEDVEQPALILDQKTGEVFHEVYEVGRTLGRGSFGIVAECVHRRTNQRHAVKILRKRAILTDRDVERVRREITVMQGLSRHRHVVELFGSYEDEKYVYLVLELCTGGDMFNRLIRIEKYSERDASQLCREALSALSHIHSHGVVYRDLKPDNFLFDTDDAASQLKAADFGLSCFIGKGEYLSSVCGTPMYVAPEVIDKSYTTKADIWSLGVTLYIMLSGKVPFWGKDMNETFMSIRRGKYHFDDPVWQTVTDAAKDCVSKMLTYDPDQRPDARTMLHHPWIVKRGLAAAKPLVDSVYLNLRQFMNMNKLQKRAVQIMATNLKLEDIKSVRKAFRELDRDQSGCITLSEMHYALSRTNLEISKSELEELWGIYDVDGDGNINYVEFLSATTVLNKILTIENMRFAFEELDKDGNGKLNEEEIKTKLMDLNLSEAEMTQLIRDADKNNDGEVDYEEFVALMTDRVQLDHARDELIGEDLDVDMSTETVLNRLLTWN